MKTYTSILLFFLCIVSFSQNAIGTWKTIDDETKKAKSHITIYEQKGKLFGKVSKILTPGKENAVCSKCKGNLKNQPILGMVVLKNLKKDGSKKWEDGTILDPNSGKTYDCYIELESKNKLKIRGFLGVSWLGRTQYWERVN